MIVCYECAKEIKIKTKAVFTNPPIYLIKLGIDFPRAFHPKCYEKRENEAKKEIENANNRIL